MAMTDLTLTFLAERAQYITGASGAAIAVVEDGGVFCRARSGFTAPAVDVPLQTSSSSLTGECLRTGETLYCQSVETDERVDVESCRQLGIESILVLPLFQQHKIAGLFEIFSTQSAAFEERDINALKRIGAMAQKALEGSLRWYEKSQVAPFTALFPVKKKRRFQRYDVGVPVSINLLRSSVPETIPGRSRNIGEGGLSAVLAGALSPGEVVVVEFLLPLIQQTFQMRASVRGQDRLRHGFEFLRPREAERTSLQPLA